MPVLLAKAKSFKVGVKKTFYKKFLAHPSLATIQKGGILTAFFIFKVT